VDIVLLHSGVGDPREWDSVRPLLEAEHRVSTPELWQEGSLIDIVLGAVPGESAVLVGASFGGGGALEAAAAAPERVEALVLINSNPFGWSDDVAAVMREEDALAEAGRLDDAAALMVRAWLVGARREEEEVPRELRDRVFAMERRAYELPQPGRGQFELDDVRAPILYIRGELDWPDVERASKRFPNARHAVIEGVAHLPALERPAEVARLVQEFIA